MRRLARTNLRASRLLFLASALLVLSCGDEAPAPVDGTAELPDAGQPGCALDEDGDGYGLGCSLGSDCDDTDPSITDECFACIPPAEGCPCDEEGMVRDCGSVSMKIGTYVTCVVGDQVCTEGEWGPCNQTGTRTMSVTKPMSLGNSTNCINNPCDPMCQHFPDDPDPNLPGLDGPIEADDDGIKLVPGPVGGGPVESCASESKEAEPLPLDVLLMVDTSGSMSGSRWTAVKSAITTFVNSDQSKGMGMGINHYPNPASSSTSNTHAMCSVSTYADFLNQGVAMGVLDGAGSTQSMAIIGEIDSWNMDGYTPTAAALQGAIQRAIAQKQALPSHEVVVVLATDGQPNRCPYRTDTSTAVNDVVNAAAVGFNGTPSIRTYVIGVSSDAGEANLHKIARAGQGITDTSVNPAYIVAGGNAQAFLNAMNDIRAQALPCEFAIPNPSSGVLDPGSTVATYTPSSGTEQSWQRVTGVGACVANQNGWYYDDPNTPSKILLCDYSCNQVKGDLNAKVRFDYSCVDDCSPRTVNAEPQPLNLYVMLDRSGSMNDEIPYSGGVTRWTRTKNALKSFSSNSGSEGIKLGLQYFGQFTSGQTCNNSYMSCSASSYKEPTVPFDTLVSPNAGAISSSLDSVSVCSGTPMRPALEGAIDKARDVINTTGEKTVVVLATDGLPTMCEAGDPYSPCVSAHCTYYWGWGWFCDPGYSACVYSGYVDEVVSVASAGQSGSPPISTYVIGAGADSFMSSQLNRIATAGGTTAALVANDSDPQAFVNAMNLIRAAELPCDYVLPSPAAGQLDPDATAVKYTPSPGSTVETWPRVDGSSSCPATGDAWYYDSATSPTRIILCGTTCDRTHSYVDGKLEFEYACVGEYNTGSFTREYDMTGQCPPSTAPVWGLWFWDSQLPDDSSINFDVSVEMPDGSFSDFVPLYFHAATPAPSWWSAGLEAQPVGATSGTNTQTAFALIDFALQQEGLPRQSDIVRVRASLRPSTDLLSTPVLKSWDIQVSCQPSE